MGDQHINTTAIALLWRITGPGLVEELSRLFPIELIGNVKDEVSTMVGKEQMISR